MAYAIVKTVNPNARETPTSPMPMFSGVAPSIAMTFAAKTALPHPPKTSQNVPSNSAAQRFPIFMIHSDYKRNLTTTRDSEIATTAARDPMGSILAPVLALRILSKF
jgi:hypothetical protein